MEVCKHSGASGEAKEQIGEAQERIRGLERRLAAAEDERDTLRSALIETRAYLDDILGSRFWRYTGPVRSLARGVRQVFRPFKRWAMKAKHGVRVPRILVIDETVPTHDQDSGSLRIFRVLTILGSRPCHVTFMPENLVFHDVYTRDVERLGIEVLHHREVDSVEGFLKARGRDYSLIWLCRPELASRLIDTAAAFAPSAALVFDTVDLHFLRMGREAALKGDPALWRRAESLKQQELTTARKAGFTIVVSQDEKERLLEHAGPLDVRVVANIHAARPLANRFEDRSGILFIGGYKHSPNVDAVEYFVSAIFPELRRRIPGVKFHVVGSHPPETIRSLACEDIVVTGHVPDVSDYFRNCRLSVAPLRFGAGVKGKVNMSMAYGLPTVITSIAAEGMHLVGGKHALVADDPSAFVACVERLYHSETLWNTLSSEGLKNIEEHFSFAAVSREIDRLLRDAGVVPPGRPARAMRRLGRRARGAHQSVECQ
jgi:glycosyltransferase involved in cell wall biosynthesis